MRSRPLALEPGGLDVEQLDIGRRDHEALDRGEQFAKLRIAGRDDRHRDRGALPLILVADLRDRNPEPVADTVDDRPDGGALHLQRSALRDVQIETDGSRVHSPILAPLGVVARMRPRGSGSGAQTRAISRSSKVSITSPGLRSW